MRDGTSRYSRHCKRDCRLGNDKHECHEGLYAETYLALLESRCCILAFRTGTSSSREFVRRANKSVTAIIS